MTLRARTLRGVVVSVLLGCPVTTLAQVSPTAPAHPTMPWTGITTPSGQLLRYVYVPPRPVTLEYMVPGLPPAPPDQGEAAEPGEPAPPAAEAPPTPPQVVYQQVTVPGYYVRETTAGFHYPERWVVEQAGPNVYRWRMLPAQFVPK